MIAAALYILVSAMTSLTKQIQKSHQLSVIANRDVNRLHEKPWTKQQGL